MKFDAVDHLFPIYSPSRSLVSSRRTRTIFLRAWTARTGTAQRWARSKSDASSMWPATHLPRYPVRRCDGCAPRGRVGGGWVRERVVCRRATGWESDACLHPLPRRRFVTTRPATDRSSAVLLVVGGLCSAAQLPAVGSSSTRRRGLGPG